MVLIIPTAIEFTGIESYERLYTERAERQIDFPDRFFTFAYRARILKTPQIPSLSSSRAAADEVSSSGSVPAHA
jgi:hypothetical protein